MRCDVRGGVHTLQMGIDIRSCLGAQTGHALPLKELQSAIQADLPVRLRHLQP